MLKYMEWMTIFLISDFTPVSLWHDILDIIHRRVSHRRVHAKRSGSGRCLSRRSGPRRRRNRGISWWKSDSRESRSFDVRWSWTCYSARNRFVGRFNFLPPWNIVVLIAFFRWSRRSDVHSTMRWLQVLSFEKDEFVLTNQVNVKFLRILSFVSTDTFDIKRNYLQINPRKRSNARWNIKIFMQRSITTSLHGLQYIQWIYGGCRYICR